MKLSRKQKKLRGDLRIMYWKMNHTQIRNLSGSGKVEALKLLRLVHRKMSELNEPYLITIRKP